MKAGKNRKQMDHRSKIIKLRNDKQIKAQTSWIDNWPSELVAGRLLITQTNILDEKKFQELHLL